MGRGSLKILFAAAEAYPLVKVGGLADVAAALPKALARRGHDVCLVLPRYACMDKPEARLSLEVPMGSSSALVHIVHYGSHKGVDVYAVDDWNSFDVAYGYTDHDIRPFVLFSRAVVAFAALKGREPHIVHCNDWHCGLIPEYARRGPHRRALRRSATVFTIHNHVHQGRLDPLEAASVGIIPDGHPSLLSRGIAHADQVNTVSKTDRKSVV